MSTSHRIIAYVAVIGMVLMTWSFAQGQEGGHILLNSVDLQDSAASHPAIEHVAVLSGTFYMGAGEQLGSEKAVRLTPGSFAVFQPGDSMFAWTEGETVIQVHGVGPWGIHYINPADDPSKK